MQSIKKKCLVCGASASERFKVSMCADTSSMKGKYQPLCFQCDYDLNEMMLTFFFGKTESILTMLNTYKERDNG